MSELQLIDSIERLLAKPVDGEDVIVKGLEGDAAAGVMAMTRLLASEAITKSMPDAFKEQLRKFAGPGKDDPPKPPAAPSTKDALGVIEKQADNPEAKAQLLALLTQLMERLQGAADSPPIPDGASEEITKAFEDQQKRIAEMGEQLKIEKRAREVRELSAELQPIFKGLAIKPDALAADVFQKIKESVSEPIFKALIQHESALAAQAQKGLEFMMKELGSDAPGAHMEAQEKINKAAAAIKKSKPELSIEQARVLAHKADPSLRKELESARG